MNYMISFSYVLYYIISAIFLYFSIFIIICLLMYTLAIVGVYACLASGGESDRDRHASLPLAREAPRSRCRSHAFFYPRLLILFLQSPAPLLGKGSIKKEQPPHSSCSLIPKGFHYIYFIPYIYIGIRSSVLLLLPQELPREPLPFPFRSQPGRRRLLP